MFSTTASIANSLLLPGVSIDGMLVGDVFGPEFFRKVLESAVNDCLQGALLIFKSGRNRALSLIVI